MIHAMAGAAMPLWFACSVRTVMLTEVVGLLLSDFGSLLPDDLRTQVKNKLGGLRTLIARYPSVFDLRGEPGKEHVRLVGVSAQKKASCSRRSSRESQQSDATAAPARVRRSSRD